MAAMEKPSLTIHRYSSRKFYNKDTKEFVTLEDISRFIRAGHSVTILDKKTGEDITNQYLLTIISEFEGQGEQVIPKDFLTEIIKSYSNAATQVWPNAIDKMMDAYQKNQENLLAAFGSKTFDPTSPEKNLEALRDFQTMQSKMMTGMLNSWQEFGNMAKPTKSSEAGTASSKTETDLDDLKSQITALQEQLNSLVKKS